MIGIAMNITADTQLIFISPNYYANSGQTNGIGNGVYQNQLHMWWKNNPLIVKCHRQCQCVMNNYYYMRTDVSRESNKTCIRQLTFVVNHSTIQTDVKANWHFQPHILLCNLNCHFKVARGSYHVDFLIIAIQLVIVHEYRHFCVYRL